MPSRTDLKGLRFGVPAELGSGAEGVEEGVGQTFDATLELIESLGGELVEVEPAARAPRHRRLLRDRAGRGVVEPRAL